MNLTNFRSELSFWNRAGRALWGMVWLLLFRPTPRLLHGWRVMLLRAFGAKIGRGVRVYPSARIYAPWNLRMGEFSILGDFVNCYCVGLVDIGSHVVVSQYSFLCTATHDYEKAEFPLVVAPIRIGAKSWIAVDVYVGPGVNIGEGVVVGARSSVFKDVEPWLVVGGTPAKVLKNRPQPR